MGLGFSPERATDNSTGLRRELSRTATPCEKWEKEPHRPHESVFQGKSLHSDGTELVSGKVEESIVLAKANIVHFILQRHKCRCYS
jgi:hypothetical protein